MPAIGLTTCTFVHGNAKALSDRVQLFTAPGVSGYGSHRIGLGDSDFEFRAVLYESAANCEAWLLAIQAAKGQVVPITDDHEQIYQYCLITEVGLPQRQPAHPHGMRYEIDLRGVQVS